jgi:hypothetical protein
MKSDNILLVFALVVVLVSIVANGFTFFSIINLASQITGFSTSGEANLTIETLASVNFTTGSINFGDGVVTSGSSDASLDTLGSGTVTNGNWSAQSGLILVNDGNVNVTLNLTGDKSAGDFIGGTNPVYEWNVSNVEANSCVNFTGVDETGMNLNTFHDVNTSLGDSVKCGIFRFEEANDQIRIDFNLTVPLDAPTGAKFDLINATAST